MFRSRTLRSLFLGAAAAALCSVSVSGQARADMIQTIDGEWLPKPPSDAPLGPDDDPSDDILRGTAESAVDATYETVKLKGSAKPADQIRRIFSAESASNENFRKAKVAAQSGFYEEAAELFAAAAAECKGFGKQEALYLRMGALANLGDAQRATAAGDDLLAAYAKSYFFAEVWITRAKIANSDATLVRKAIDAIKSAPGMNARDLVRAEYVRIWLTEEVPKNFDKALESYQKLAADIERSAPVAGAVTRQQALVGIGNCLLRKGKGGDAAPYFLKAAKESKNADVLAGAYDGLGGIAFNEAKVLQESKKMTEAKDKLEEAALHYLRVSLLYRNDVDDMSPVLDALENQARVFVALFDISNQKDCESARRAHSAYYELQGLITDPIAKRRLVKEGTEFYERKKAACGG